MSELAVKRMTLAEFLRWEDGTDTRYELLGGSPVAMAPPAIAHGVLALRLELTLRCNLGRPVSVRARRGSSDQTVTTPVMSPISRSAALRPGPVSSCFRIRC
jgi:Uma2 family endonuclease